MSKEESIERESNDNTFKNKMERSETEASLQRTGVVSQEVNLPRFFFYFIFFRSPDAISRRFQLFILV